MPKREPHRQEVYDLALGRLKTLAAGGRGAKSLSHLIIMGDEPQDGDAARQTPDDFAWAAQVILTGLTGSSGCPLNIPLRTVCLIVNVAVKLLSQTGESSGLLNLAIQRFVRQFQEEEINPLAECPASNPGVYVVWCDIVTHERSPSVRGNHDLTSFRPDQAAANE